MGLLVVHLIQLMLLLSMLLVMLLLLLLLGQSFSSRVGISFESKSSRELVTEFVIIKLCLRHSWGQLSGHVLEFMIIGR